MSYAMSKFDAFFQTGLNQTNQIAVVVNDGHIDLYVNDNFLSAEQQLVNDVAWLPLYQTTYPFVLKPYVQGVVFNAQSLIPPNDWGNIYISVH